MIMGREGELCERARKKPQVGGLSALFVLLLAAVSVCYPASSQPGQQGEQLQLAGNLGESAQLPCLIGRQLYCGEPYFIAWYKFNGSTKSWLRIEHERQAVLGEPAPGGGALSARVQFGWRRTGGAQAARPSQALASAACGAHPLAVAAAAAAAAASGRPAESQFDCATLTISPLELIDEGQYKCEITFSESLDFDKCPPTTASQLSVIGE